MAISKKLGNYTLDILDCTEFKSYYNENKNSLSGLALNSFLKAVDIPPKFFLEQPEETQAELVDNRDTFIRENKKYFNKVIIVAKNNFGDFLNAARIDTKVEKEYFDKLKTIEEVTGKFEHRSFLKDGYITLVVSDDIKKGIKNQVLVIDFPLLMNKKVVIHNALYQLPDDTFATPVEHIQYLSSKEVTLVAKPKSNELPDYNNIKEAIEDNASFLKEKVETKEEDILREPELVSIALVETDIIPRSYVGKVGEYISSNLTGTLTTKSLESLILDFDETFKSYKQVSNLRSINGEEVLKFLNSDKFKELEESIQALD